MNPILIVIPFHAGNAAQAETLVDFIYHFAGRETVGCALPVAAKDVHAEPRERIKIACGLAFQHFEMIQTDKFIGDKPAQIANAFKVVSMFIAQNYYLPWLWLEPDCTPLVKNWRGALETAYWRQNKLMLKGSGPRIGIYPAEYADLKIGPNAVRTSNLIFNREPGSDAKIPVETVLLHRDQNQTVLQTLRAGLK